MIASIFFVLFFAITPLHSFEIPGAAWVRELFHMGQLQANCSEQTPIGTPIFTAPEKVLKMYQLMKDIHDVFTHYKVSYRIDSGTLLGAIRHGGIIPWDDDLDICIDKNDIDKAYVLAPIFDALGYEVITLLGSFHRVQRKDDMNIFADLLVTEQRGDKIYFSPFLPMYLYNLFYGDNGLFGYRDGEEIFIPHGELYPLKEYTFGNLTVMGPQNPAKYLESMYGRDYLDVAYQWHQHQDGRFLKPKKVRMILSDKDKVPAQPIGPMRERLAALAVLMS